MKEFYTFLVLDFCYFLWHHWHLRGMGARRTGRGQPQLAHGGNRYPILEQVQVYYDPDDPATVVLEPGISFGSIIPFLAGFLMLLGGPHLLFVARRRQNK